MCIIIFIYYSTINTDNTNYIILSIFFSIFCTSAIYFYYSRVKPFYNMKSYINKNMKSNIYDNINNYDKFENIINKRLFNK